jgi:cytochrome c553
LEERIIKTPFAATALSLVASLLLPLPAAAQTSSFGRNLAAACANCHGTHGVSTGGMPALAGQPRQYLAQTLKDFRDGRRPGTIMPQLAKGYADNQIDALAEYLAAQKAGQ